MKICLVGEKTSPPRSCGAVAKGEPAGQEVGGREAPALAVRPPPGTGGLAASAAAIACSTQLLQVTLSRSHCSRARPALPCPASSSLQRLPPTAGRTLDSASEIPPSGPTPHPQPKGPREEEKGPASGLYDPGPQPRSGLPNTGSTRDSVVWNFLEKCVSGRGLGLPLTT